MTMPGTALRVTADDYGLTPAVNAGIEELARRGAITAVSVTTHAGAALETASRLAETPVAIGLHVVLVEEAPLLGRELAPLLDARGRLPATWARLFTAVSSRPGLLALCRREAQAQLERLLDLGLPCDFVNSHQHVHLFPPLWAALGPLWERTQRAVRARAPWCGGVKQRLLAASSFAAFTLRPTRARILRPIGIDAAGRMDRHELARSLQRARRWTQGNAGTASDQMLELVTHPGTDDRETGSRYRHWNYQWQTERDTLLSDELGIMLQHHGFAKERR